MSNSIEIMRGNLKDAAQQWDELLRLVKEKGAFKEEQILLDKAPNLTPPRHSLAENNIYEGTIM